MSVTARITSATHDTTAYTEVKVRVQGIGSRREHTTAAIDALVDLTLEDLMPLASDTYSVSSPDGGLTSEYVFWVSHGTADVTEGVVARRLDPLMCGPEEFAYSSDLQMIDDGYRYVYHVLKGEMCYRAGIAKSHDFLDLIAFINSNMSQLEWSHRA